MPSPLKGGTKHISKAVIARVMPTNVRFDKQEFQEKTGIPFASCNARLNLLVKAELVTKIPGRRVWIFSKSNKLELKRLDEERLIGNTEGAKARAAEERARQARARQGKKEAKEILNNLLYK